MLTSNRPLTASEILDLYYSRNNVEAAFRDLKHGIDWRLARCTSDNAIRGRILVFFLPLSCLYMLRFLYPEFGSKTAESITEELSSLSVTVLVADSEEKTCFQQLRMHYPPSLVRKDVCFGAEGTRTDVDRRFLTSRKAN